MLKLHPRAAATPVCRRPLAHPVRDWTLLMLGTTTLLVLLIIAAAVPFLFAVSPDASESISVKSAGLNIQKLENTLRHYRDLKTEHLQLLSAPPPATDPAK